jgi:penicillin-binding protein 1C
VSASEALVRSLNLPAVQVLEAYGPKRFAANLRNAGLPLTLPAGAEPNLSLILGGAGARLEDIVAAYSAFARHGKAARLRMKPGRPAGGKGADVPGRRGSSGAFWPAKRNRFPMPHCRKWCRWRGKPAPATAIAMRGRSASMRDI